MKIELELNGTKYHIDPTPECFIPYKHIIVKTGDNKGDERENALGFYSKMSNAVNAIIRQEIADSPDTVSLTEFVERYEKALAELREYVDF